MPRKKKLLLIDAHAVIHRAFHALPTLTTKTGEPINAVYGFLLIVLRALHDIKPEYVAVAFDSKGKTFRHKKFAEYKATRKTPDDALVSQFPIVVDITKTFGFPVFAQEGYEADDIIGTINQQVEDHDDIETIIVTGDLDLLQLVDENTKVLKMHKGIRETQLFDRAMVQEHTGLTPAQIVDFKGLRGDASDNIPGVRGIGEKGAVTLLQEFGTIDGIYEHLDRVPERLRQLLSEQKKSAMLSRELATIDRRVPLEFSLEKAAVRNVSREQAVDILRKYEFKSLLPQLQRLSFLATSATAPDHHLASRHFASRSPLGERDDVQYHLVCSDEEIAEFARQLAQKKVFAFDTETASLYPLRDPLVGMSFSWKEKEGYYVACGAHVPASIATVLENPQIHKVGHNAKFDIQAMHHAGVRMTGVVFDTMIASYLLNASTRKHSLAELAFLEFGVAMQPIEELIGKGKKQISMQDVPVDKVAWYASEDADCTWRLYERYAARIQREGFGKLMDDIEMPTVQVLVTMEEAGVKIDTDFLAVMSTELHHRLAAIEKKIYKHAGAEFNIASPLQLKKILFETLGLSTKKIGKTKTGFSTAAGELEKLQGLHPIIEHIREHRELSKLLSTYVDALPKLINPATQRIHTSFNQTIAATGRLSSSDPNLQNIPVRTELGQKIRKAFVPERGHRILSCDYSQVELRVVAHLADDKVMKEAFVHGEDIHVRTAAELHDIPLQDVTSEMRRAAKVVNFGILYGMGAMGIVRDSGIAREEATAFLEKYFTIHKGIFKYLERVKAFAHTHQYVETMFGRRRFLPEINSRNPGFAAAAERAAVNMPIQGTVADMMKLAMIAVQAAIDAGDVEARMILQVHDELVFEVEIAKVEKEARKIVQIMEEITRLSVPLVVDAEVGCSWGDLESLSSRT